jgi:hypothetical protein
MCGIQCDSLEKVTHKSISRMYARENREGKFFHKQDLLWHISANDAEP